MVRACVGCVGQDNMEKRGENMKTKCKGCGHEIGVCMGMLTMHRGKAELAYFSIPCPVEGCKCVTPR